MTQSWLPLVPVSSGRVASPWPWRKHGFGYPQESGVDAHLLSETGAWWYDWSWRHGVNQIPMVWRSIDNRIWEGNDGRPVFVLNEPERSGQADLTPVQAADVVARILDSWTGEVWGIGTLAHELDYCDAVCAAYQAVRGKPLELTGWAVHVYSNRAVWERDINSASYVDGALADLDAFIAHQRAAGRLGRGVIITEYGALSATYWHSVEEMVDMFAAYEAGFQQRGDVVAWAPFSANYPPYDSTDLLNDDGTLTALGRMWMEYTTA